MFLGTYTPKLDDKGRLTLPAKFRDALSGGLMVTKSQDHSLAVYPRAEFEEMVRTAGKAKRSNPQARAFLRNLAAGTDEQHPDAQGRITFPPTTAATRTSPRTASSSVPLSFWRSGMQRPGSNTRKPTKRTSPRPAMKHSATLSEARARATWPLPEPTLTYFPDARFVHSGRDLDAGAPEACSAVHHFSVGKVSHA